MRTKPILYIVIPCYNEEEVIENTTQELKKKIDNLIKKDLISRKSKVMYVNDGSKDNTWEIIKSISKKEKQFTGISLSRNMGHQNALFGGLMTSLKYADVVISMDADLQDDIDVIDSMIIKYHQGCDIVYGVRSKRKKDRLFKKGTAHLFYRLMRFMGADIISNHADFRLTSKKVLEELSNFHEVNLFLRGIFPLIGYQQDIVYYERKKRLAGVSKYPLQKMINFAWNGITSFSIKPIRMILILGILIFMISIVVIIYSLIRKLTGNTVTGWTFIVCSIWLIAGIQMASLGMIGEYIGKIYQEVKGRPRYIISENLLEKKK